MKTSAVSKTSKLGLFILIIISFFAYSYSDKGTVNGVITDVKTKAVLQNVVIEAKNNSTLVASTISDVNGAYSLDLPVGLYKISYNLYGYNILEKDVYVKQDKTTQANIQLQAYKLDSIYPLPSVQKVSTKQESKREIIMAPSVEYMYEDDISGSGYYQNISPQESYDDVPHNTEEYQKINENRIKDTKVSPISTFSIDVDRAAYSNVRRFINEGQKPYADAVRIEEMINYFTYNYPQPTNNDPFSITIESTKCPWNPNSELVLIGLQGEQLSTEQVPASNLVFLIDVSGSMDAPNKLGLLKQAFAELVGKLRPQDKVSIVVYAGAAGLVLPATSGVKKQEILNSLNSLEAGGSTAGGAGIELAYKVAQENFIVGGNNRVIIATDGDFNVGASSDGEMVRLIERKREEGVFLTVLGFGMGNYKDSKMEQLSNAGNGNYAYIDNINEAKKIFGVELWGTLYTIAKDVKIQVEFNPAVVATYRLIGYENRMLQTEDFNDDKKDAGEIGSGHSVTALYEITYVTAGNSTQNQSKYISQTYTNKTDILTVNIRYKEPEETVSKLITKTVQKNTLTQSSNILFASCIVEFGMILRDSEFKGSSSIEHVLTTIQSIEMKDTYGYIKEFKGIVTKAKEIYL